MLIAPPLQSLHWNFRNSRSMQSITEPNIAVSRSFSPLANQSHEECRQRIGKEKRAWCFASFPCKEIWARLRLEICDYRWIKGFNSLAKGFVICIFYSFSFPSRFLSFFFFVFLNQSRESCVSNSWFEWNQEKK